MNYYFLLEDEKSFLKVLPSWLEHGNFGCTRVADITEVNENNYVLQSGQGVDQLITKVLYQTIDTITGSDRRIDELVVIIDAEQKEVEERRLEVWNKIKDKYCVQKLNFKINVIVCNHCFETWLLGKHGLYPEKIEKDSFFYPFYNHYNIDHHDPENMNVPAGSTETIAKYHFHYLHELFRYRKIRYRKNKPPEMIKEKEFYDALVKRFVETSHLKSFGELYRYISRNLVTLENNRDL